MLALITKTQLRKTKKRRMKLRKMKARSSKSVKFATLLRRTRDAKIVYVAENSRI